MGESTEETTDLLGPAPGPVDPPDPLIVALQRVVTFPTAYDVEQIRFWRDEDGSDDVLLAAIDESADKGGHSVRYIGRVRASICAAGGVAAYRARASLARPQARAPDSPPPPKRPIPRLPCEEWEKPDAGA